jgi:hypothetical protein
VGCRLFGALVCLFLAAAAPKWLPARPAGDESARWNEKKSNFHHLALQVQRQSQMCRFVASRVPLDRQAQQQQQQQRRQQLELIRLKLQAGRRPGPTRSARLGSAESAAVCLGCLQPPVGKFASGRDEKFVTLFQFCVAFAAERQRRQKAGSASERVCAFRIMSAHAAAHKGRPSRRAAREEWKQYSETPPLDLTLFVSSSHYHLLARLPVRPSYCVCLCVLINLTPCGRALPGVPARER